MRERFRIQRLADLTAANETAENNRLEATQALQRVQVVEEEKRREVGQLRQEVGRLSSRLGEEDDDLPTLPRRR